MWSAVKWWEEWQLRALVLGSLALQWFLLGAGMMRRFAIPLWFRRCIWLAYLGGDAMAIYALATLFNRHASSSICATSAISTLEVLWAPVLLIHLGGHPGMSAYSIEDSELWQRQVITLVSQVTVALYAFCRSWPSSGDRRLLATAVLLFAIGIFRFYEKPLALKRASIKNQVPLSMLSPSLQMARRSGNSDKKTFISRCLTLCFTDSRSRLNERHSRRVPSDSDKVQMVLADMSLLSADAQGNMVLTPVYPPRYRRQYGYSYDRIRSLLDSSFTILYTRGNMVISPVYMSMHLLLLPSLYMVVVVLFTVSHKHDHNATDVKVTYILLCFTATMDVLAFCIVFVIFTLMQKAQVPQVCEMVAQYNLISSALHTNKQSVIGWITRCVEPLGCTDAFAAASSMRRRHAHLGAAENIISGIEQYLRYVGKDVTAWDVGAEERGGAATRRSLREDPFDRRVLVWHIAADLCFRRRRDDPDDNNEVIEVVSNYMAYLLNFHPDMLLTGSRQFIFTQAMEEVKFILKGHQDEQGPAIVDAIIEGVTKADIDHHSVEEEELKGEAGTRKHNSILYDSCMLAQELMDLPVDAMLKTIQEVWLGMLCYSAAMCRGYLHAKSLAEGGEFLTIVWLSHCINGVKVLADKLQMPQPRPQQAQQQDMPTTASTSQNA